jgi:pimeloyl-ACP methyl ester carboxylesterase
MVRDHLLTGMAHIRTAFNRTGFNRRAVLKSMAGAAALAAPSMRVTHAFANDDATPILFLHGNGDHAALWLTTLWRFESNGFPHARLFALNFLDPLARDDDAIEQPLRSSSEDQRRALATAIAEIREKTGAARVALVGNSRGGFAIRNHVVRHGGSAAVSHAVLCGTPNRGVFSAPFNTGSEFNGQGPFLKQLNAAESDVVAGTAFLTLRSETNDKFAQPDGFALGRPGVATGVGYDGPELRGARNIVLGQLDHREVAFHPRAFREIYRFIRGREPERLDILAQPRVRLDGLVTGFPDGIATNRPVAEAEVAIFRVDPETGLRVGEAVHRATTGRDGRWGPFETDPDAALEFVIRALSYPTTHIYRSPFPRSSSIVHLRPARPLTDADRAAGAVVLFSRPRGYFGLPRDVVLFDGKEPSDIACGVPVDSLATLRLPVDEAGRAVAAVFNEERLVVRAWPASENRIAIAELHT